MSRRSSCKEGGGGRRGLPTRDRLGADSDDIDGVLAAASDNTVIEVGAIGFSPLSNNDGTIASTATAAASTAVAGIHERRVG